MAKKYGIRSKRRRQRITETLVSLRNKWVSSKELSRVTDISTMSIGLLLRSAVKGGFVARRSYMKHQRYHVDYKCLCGDEDELYDALTSSNVVFVRKEGVVDPAVSENWFAVAERLMQQ